MKQRRGFTFLEVIISVTLMVSVFVIAITAVANVFRENKTRQSMIAATDHANQIVRSVVSLLRQAEPSVNGAYPIAAASSTSLTFFTATPGSTAIQQARLFLDGTNLKLGLTPPSNGNPPYPAANEVVSTLLSNVRNGGATPLFKYFDKNYTGTQAALNPIVLTNIRLVTVTVLFDEDTTKPPNATTIELQAALRNLKDNY